jgi:hypothetical protein
MIDRGLIDRGHSQELISPRETRKQEANMAVAPADVKRSIVEPLARSIVTPGAPIVALAKTWHHINVANAAAAVSFINAPPPQGAGEASFTNGPNGTVDVYYFL